MHDAKARSRRNGLDLSGPQESLGYNVRRADVYLREQFRGMLGRWHVRPVEYSILRLVERNPSATQAEIADALYIKRQNIGGLVARLERMGWLRRDVDPSDRRRQSLALTAAGAKRLAALARAAARMDRELTGGWSDAERAAVVRLLQRLYTS
jgi:DNA-binding MarR family transcriptional regulator